MFKYLINDQEVTFNSEEERLKGIAEAEANGYSIELLEEPEFETSDAPKSAFSQIMQGESPEDFITDPAESADAVSETVAQEDTELLLDDGSTELPSGENYNIDGKPVTKKEFETYDAEVKADKPLELTLSKEDYEFNQGIQKKLNETPPPPEWDFWSETGTKIQAATTRSLGKLARIPIFLKEMQFAYSKAFLSEEEQARIDALPPKVQQAMALMSGGGSFSSASMVKAATMGLEKYEESVIKAKKIEETLTEFDTTIVDQYAAGNFTEATVRTISDALGSIPSVVQAMIPYVGIASIVVGEAAGASGEVQEEGEGISAKTMGYSLVRGASEGLLELTTKKIGKGLFKSLTGKPKDIVVKELKDIALGVGKEYGQEGLSESATLTINTAADLLILGREDAFDGYLEELGDTFLVGAAMGGGMSGSGAGISIVKQGIQAKKINKQLKETGYKNLIDAYRTTEVPDALVNLSLNPAVQSFLNKDLDNKVKSGDITTEESDNIKRNFADMQGAAKAVNASTISDTNAGEAVELLTEKTRLEADIKTIGDKSLSGPQQLRVDTIKTLLDKLAGQGVLEAKTKKADAILKQLGGKGVVEVSNEKQMAAKFDQINKEDQKLHDDAQQKAIEAGEKTFKVGETEFSVDSQYKSNAKEFGGYGTYVPRLDGTAEVIINKAVAFEDGMVNTAAHEVLHYALRETLKSTVAQKKTGAALLNYVKGLQVTENINDEFRTRLKQYKDASFIKEADQQEEVLTLLSEAMLDGKLKFNENTSAKLLDFGRRLLSSMGFASVKFNTGKDVFNFIKDYNRSIEKGKLDKGLAGSLKKGIKGKLTDSTIKDQPKKKQSAKPSLTTNKVDTALAALEEAEALRDEDFDNPTLAANVEKAEAAYDQALIEAENLEEDAAIETVEEATKEKIVRPKADKTKRRYSLDANVKKEIEPQIAKAQALNKELIVQEKELNKKAIADIEAIPDKEVKRTEKDKRIAELKANPLRVSKSNELNKLEREISKELKTPIDKAVNLFTKLYYDKISDNAKTAVTRDEFKESARAEITSITINEFKPKTINRQGESVVNDIEDIIFQRGGLRLRSLAERLGVVGKDQGIARGAEALIKMADSSSDINFDENDKDSVRSEEKRKVSALLASEARYNQAREQVVDFWKENEGNTKVENFKKLPNLINNILAEMFNVTEGTLTARSGNLNKADYANAIKAFTEKQAVFTVKEGDTKKEVRVPVSEVSAFQDGLNEKKADNKDFSYKREVNESIAEALLRFLPQTSADDYTYASGRKGRFSGKSTGLPKNLMGLAYKIDGRKTTGIGNVERTAQKLTVEEIYDAIGAGFDADGNVVQKMGLSGKNKEGQTMLGLIKLLGRMVTNEISRTETDLDPMTKMDIAAGKNRMMFSLKIERGLKQGLGIEVNTDLSEGNLNNTRNLFKDISEELGSQGTVDYLVPLISRGYGTYYTKNGKVFFEPGRFSIFKNREDFFSSIDIDDFKDFKSGDRKVVINDTDVTLKINFDQNAKNLNKFADQITERQEFAKDQRKGLNKIAKILKSKLEEDFEGNKDAVASVLQTMNSNVDGLIRTAAIPKFMFLETNETSYVYEHSKTASDTLVELSQLIFSTDSKVDFDKEFNEIMSDFVVSIIPKSYDNMLNEVFKSNGPREGDSKSNYAKPLIKSKDGIPVRYTDQAFTSLLLKNGMAPMNVVPITKEGLQDHLSSVKSSKKLIKENTKLLPKNLRQEGITNNQAIKNAENFDKAIALGNSLDQENRGISVWDFDDTLATTKSNVLYTMPDGTTGKIDAAQFAKEGDAMLASGAEFDFSEFSKVVKGAKGPFFEKAMARNKKFGNENVFILTARPANSALAIHEFLKGIGLDIPLANITGLANSDPQAKANWVLSKFAEGYNDFYFADDHIGNVKAVKEVLSVLDVKSKVQQARVKSSLQLSKRFNEIIEEESGIEAFKEYQSVKAAKKGAKKGKFKFFVPPSAEDFLGLLYTTLPKGKKGESAMAFYKEHLLDPYGKAVTGLRTGRITIAKNYKALKKELGIVPRTLKKNFKYEDENGNMKESLFTKEDAIRVYTWDAQGLDIPGLSNVDLPILVNYVNSNPDLKAFADKLLGLNKNTEPKAPTESWPAGTITSDLLNTLNTDGRKQLLEVWQQNVDAIFTPTNLNKLEAAYGKPYVTALKDSLRRMRTGRNSTPTNNGVTDGIVRWLNAAVGNIMFLNRRSAVLQLISFTNFINFEGNNLYQAGKAFANQPQYWKDWVYLMNSDYLVDRRDGLKINVNEADIATTAKENGFQGVLAKILQVGFIPTKMADSAAIATGGASFYRNRVNALVKGGMSKAAAEKQAMQDFVATAEVSQQSSDPSKISKQQAEPIGRIILAFANTPSQYARIIKRAAQDLKNGRGDAKTHLSRIVYYGVLQNVVFNFLQQAMFAAMFGDDEDESEEATAAKSTSNTKKAIKVANSMTDGILRGIGVAGAVVSVAKNLAIKLYERSQKTRNQNLAATIKDEVMKISPPISSKLSKAGKVGNAFEWGKKEIEFDEMSLKHPYVTAATNTVAALTGLPLDRAQGMAIDAVDIASDETETWMKPLIALGWPKWQLMSEEDTKAEREEAKERFKGLKEDKEYDQLNPTEKRRKALKDLSKKEQVDMLWNAGVSRTEIKGLSKEADRIDKLMDIQNKKQFDKDMEAISRGEEIGEPVKIEKPKKEKNKYSKAMQARMKVLKDLSKAEQVDFLWNAGVTKTQLRGLSSEESRILKIIELQNKKRKNSLK